MSRLNDNKFSRDINQQQQQQHRGVEHYRQQAGFETTTPSSANIPSERGQFASPGLNRFVARQEYRHPETDRQDLVNYLTGQRYRGEDPGGAFEPTHYQLDAPALDTLSRDLDS